MLEDSIEVRLSTLLNLKCALVYGNILIEKDNSKIRYLCQFDDILEYNQKEYLMKELSLCCTSTIMVRRSILNKIGCLDENLKAWQDDDLIIRFGMKYKICHCKKNVAIMVQSRKSITTNKENLYQGCKSIVRKYKKQIIEYTSYMRYCLWKLRVISSWLKYKEQIEKKSIKKMLYKIIYCGIDRILENYFRHNYG